MTSASLGNFCRPSLPVHSIMVLFLFLCPFADMTRARSNANHVESHVLEYYEPDIEPYDSQLVSSRTTSSEASSGEPEVEEVASTSAPASTGKPVFAFRKNGVRVDIRMLPAENKSLRLDESLNADDRFPEFPIKDIGGCVFKLSLTCVGKRLTLFLETIGRLDEITILGQAVKLVRTRVPVRTVTDRRMVDAPLIEAIDRAIENFFETFSLRITLPRMNRRNERSRIDVELDEAGERQEEHNDLVEGRGKKGGGGGGGKGDKGGGGGKCKRMMMFMLMMIKMKMMGVIGVTAMKGMMMAGMSLMISKFMLIQKLMALKKGGGGGGGGGGGAPWQSAGGGGGSGPLKEIILVTKASGGSSAGGAGGAGCCGGGPSDSYGAPPANSYGPPSGGGDGYDYGGGGGGGGWGRSFDNGAIGSSNEEATVLGRNTTNANPEYSPVGIASRVPHWRSLHAAPLAYRYYENYRNTKRNSDTSKSTVNASATLQSSSNLNLQRISNFRDEEVFNTTI